MNSIVPVRRARHAEESLRHLTSDNRFLKALKDFFAHPLDVSRMRHAPQVGMSRREFLMRSGQLGLLAAFGGMAGFSDLAAQAQDSLVSVEESLASVPPSLMLHSRDDYWLFADTLIRNFKKNSYNATTYQGWEQAIRAGTPIERPVIVSIDDITMAQGNRSFPTFRKMHDQYKAAGLVGVFAVITRPDVRQDEALWDEVAGWVEEGFELATHTSYHSTFNAFDTSPRIDFKPEDYSIEIIESAQLIEEKMRDRGIDYKVRTLITPFGSGYSYGMPRHEIHPGITEACARTNIKFVVGIVEGKEPVNSATLALDNTDLVYMGRMSPKYQIDEKGANVPQGDGTFRFLNYWQAKSI